MMQFANSVSIRFSSELQDISRVLQKLLKYFNDTAISTSFVLPTTWVVPVIFALILNDVKSVTLSFELSLWLPYVFA